MVFLPRVVALLEGLEGVWCFLPRVVALLEDIYQSLQGGKRSCFNSGRHYGSFLSGALRKIIYDVFPESPPTGCVVWGLGRRSEGV